MSLKLLNAHVTNFGSYRELEFDYTNLGLSLVYGATGSGKSSLLDVAPWVLFGITAKGGKVDDVRSWQTDEPTAGMVDLIVDGSLLVVRTRGKSSENDLYWIEGYTEEGEPIIHRGKDVKDTQRLLNERLGVTPDLYLAAAYASEFSPTARFFTDNAKRQREIFDLVADLSFPITLAERASSVRKEAKKELEELQRSYAKATGRLDELLRAKDFAVKQAASWEESQARAIKELETRAENFEAEKAEKLVALYYNAEQFEIQRSAGIAAICLIGTPIDDLEKQAYTEGPCSACGADVGAIRRDELRQRNNAIERVKAEVNPYMVRYEDLEFNKPGFDYMIKAKKEETNPHLKTTETAAERLTETETYVQQTRDNMQGLDEMVSSLTQLIDLSSTMRGTLLTRTVVEIQTETNRILETYFDGEIRVDFCLNDDDLQVGIKKNGYEATYAQLSKGQRQLLKLSFMISVMKSAANNGGVSFAQRFFDESLDGLDADLKVKAYGLFQEIAQESDVMVIEHAEELKSLFSSKYKVTLAGDYSLIENENA